MKMQIATSALAIVLVGGCTHVPRDMVAFFNADACPNGWVATAGDWNGRYVVIGNEGRGQLVGEALSHGENRVTGDHGHAGTAIVITGPRDNATAGSDGSVGWSYREVSPDSATPRNTGETVRPGTNAPYVRLPACTKQ